MDSDRPIDIDSLSYRPIRDESELPWIARLFDIAGWGPVPAERLGQWFMGGELGGSIIMVVADDKAGEVLGMSVMSPYRVWLMDRVGVACRGRAAVLDPRLRRLGRGVNDVDETDPLYKLGLVSREIMDERGWEFSYGLPNPKIVKREELRTIPVEGCESKCELGLGLLIDLEQGPPLGSNLEVRTGTEFGPEYDILWERAKKSLGIECAVLRNAEGLAHARSNQFRLEFRRPVSEELVGYATFQNMRNGKLQDILALDEEAMEQVMRSMVDWLRTYPDAHNMWSLTSTPHPAYRSALEAVRPSEVDWMFSISLNTHHDRVGPEFDATKFYVTTGD